MITYMLFKKRFDVIAWRTWVYFWRWIFAESINQYQIVNPSYWLLSNRSQEHELFFFVILHFVSGQNWHLAIIGCSF